MDGNMATKATRVYRHKAPRFKYRSTRNILVRRVMAALDRHDFMRNPAISKLWGEGGFLFLPRGKVKYVEPRAYRMRKDCEETLREVMKALIYRADLADSDEFFLEVKASARQIADDVGQLHVYEPDYNGSGQYRHGRYTYDPVKARLHDMEAAKILIAQREYCPVQKRYLATRYWITPEFFMHLGVTRSELIRMIRGLRKSSHKQTKAEHDAKERRRLIRDSRLQDSIKPAIKPYLDPIAQLNREINHYTNNIENQPETPKRKAPKQSPRATEEGSSKRAFISSGYLIPHIRDAAKSVMSVSHPEVKTDTDDYYNLLYDYYIQALRRQSKI